MLGTLPAPDTGQSFIIFPAITADMQCYPGVEGRGANEGKEVVSKAGVSHRAPLGGACLLFSTSPSSLRKWGKPGPVVETDFVRM